MMAELGGPAIPDEIPLIIRRTLEVAETGSGWALKIILDVERGVTAGDVIIWEKEHAGEPIVEIGWAVLPEFQRQGLATRAVSEVLRRARERPGWEIVHAFPAVTNVASNALCRRLGFVNLGQELFDYNLTQLTCNHWRIDVREMR